MKNNNHLNKPIADDILKKKSEAELEKLNVEIDEIRERIQRSKSWYKGRYLFQALIGGIVTAALFTSWFIQFYKPMVDLQKEKLVSAYQQIEERNIKQTEKYNDKIEELETEHNSLLQRLTHENKMNLMRYNINREEYEKQIRGFLEYEEDISHGLNSMKIWCEGLNKRFKNNIKTIESMIGKRYLNQQDVASLLHIMNKESEGIEETVKILQIDISDGNKAAWQLKTTLFKLDNSDIKIRITYDYEFKELALQAEKILNEQGFNINWVDPWGDFKEPGDKEMAYYFEDGPVVWYNNEDIRTSEKADLIISDLNKILPRNMLLKNGHDIVVPETTWSMGSKMIQLWFFKKENY